MGLILQSVIFNTSSVIEKHLRKMTLTFGIVSVFNRNDRKDKVTISAHVFSYSLLLEKGNIYNKQPVAVLLGNKRLLRH